MTVLNIKFNIKEFNIKKIKEIGEIEEIEEKHKAALWHYSELLASYSAARLTGSRDARELYDLHIKDSLYSVILLPEAKSSGIIKAIDVGSGGGLPGIVWAICRPDISVTLLDSIRKKCHAMSEFSNALALNNVSVVCARCEEYAFRDDNARQVFDIAAARAVAHVGVIANYLAPLVKPGGNLVAFKGPKGLEELKETEAKTKWQSLRLSTPNILPYNINERNYFFIMWEKL